MKIAIEIADWGEKRKAYANLGNSFHAMGNYKKAIDYLEKSLKIALESVIGVGKEQPTQTLLMPTTHWVTIEKPLSIMKSI